MEEEARRRAVEGVAKLKFHQGQLIHIPVVDADGQPVLAENGEPKQKPYVEHEYSDTLLIFLLKGARPKKFRENMDVTSGDKPLTFNPITMDGGKEASVG